MNFKIGFIYTLENINTGNIFTFIAVDNTLINDRIKHVKKILTKNKNGEERYLETVYNNLWINSSDIVKELINEEEIFNFLLKTKNENFQYLDESYKHKYKDKYLQYLLNKINDITI